MTDNISAKPWTIAMDGDDFRVHHDTDGRLSAADAIVAMPRWAPKMIRALFDLVAELRGQIAKGLAITTLTPIRPISTAPRVEGARYDIWVRKHGTRYSPDRVPNAQWTVYAHSNYARESNPPRFPGWFIALHSGGYYHLERDEEVVGWSPIPEWKQP